MTRASMNPSNHVSARRARPLSRGLKSVGCWFISRPCKRWPRAGRPQPSPLAALLPPPLAGLGGRWDTCGDWWAARPRPGGPPARAAPANVNAPSRNLKRIDSFKHGGSIQACVTLTQLLECPTLPASIRSCNARQHPLFTQVTASGAECLPVIWSRLLPALCPGVAQAATGAPSAPPGGDAAPITTVELETRYAVRTGLAGSLRPTTA